MLFSDFTTVWTFLPEKTKKKIEEKVREWIKMWKGQTPTGRIYGRGASRDILSVPCTAKNIFGYGSGTGYGMCKLALKNCVNEKDYKFIHGLSWMEIEGMYFYTIDRIENSGPHWKKLRKLAELCMARTAEVSYNKTCQELLDWLVERAHSPEEVTFWLNYVIFIRLDCQKYSPVCTNEWYFDILFDKKCGSK